ncbi:siderophore-interacting protein [Galactobacter caseinivorans]|uniref:Siderophore-interacting protein n=1 Tax=Galactobacter caseinivorans TaxID=2676123 RepID=A0A496PI53_9MICC|nr:siderophore-interacting protein [Galactobacter caseinivorans]RKW70173.1 siderophore-interacting protein [Galactobacter caseinivorans]
MNAVQPLPGTVSAVSQTLAFRGIIREVIDLGPGLRRLVLGGPDLAHLGLNGPTLDLRFKVIVPAEGAREASIGAVLEPLLPHTVVEQDTEQSWYQQWLQAPVSQRGLMRTYTIRALRDVEGERRMDVDLVLHGVGPDGSVGPGCGPAAAFAANAAVGDALYLLGPNRHLTDADYGGIDFRPGQASHLLIVGDETAAPAICSILDELPRTATGWALIEVPDAGQIQDVTPPDGVEVRWLVRGGEQAVGALLAPAVAQTAPLWLASSVTPSDSAAAYGKEPEDVDVDQSVLWESPLQNSSRDYAWIAGEAGVVKELRRHLVRDLGVDRTRIAFMGYWRQGRSGD